MVSDKRHASTPRGPIAPELSDRDKAILEFERKWWRHEGAKASTAFQIFEMTEARYHQALSRLVYTEAAVLYAPDVCRRQRAKLEGTNRRRITSH